MPAVRELEGERHDNDCCKEREGIHGSGALQDHAFDDVGNIFTLIDSSLDDFKNLLPLDDLNRISFFIEELSDQRAADTVALILKAIDFDAVLQGFVSGLDGVNQGRDFGASSQKNFCKLFGAWAGHIHAIKNEAAGGGVN